MASLRACNKSSHTTSRKQANENLEETIISSDSDSMDASDNSPEQEPAETQSKSARELLTDMVAGVCPWPSSHTIPYM
jgi:hypothetical protein